jgi:pyruvate,water dikinase
MKVMLGRIRRLFARPSERRALAFQLKYQHFQSLLEANSDLLEVMGDISETLAGSDSFSIGYVRDRTTALFVEAFKILRYLRTLSPDDGRRLTDLLDTLQQKAAQILKTPVPRHDVPYVLPLDQINRTHGPLVGNKMAWLGEMYTELAIPVPAGFAISVRFDGELHRQGGLQDEINKVITSLNYEDQAAVHEAGQSIQSMVVGAPLPAHVEAEILAAYDRLAEQVGGEPRMAVRSSAIGEDDPRCSCAGLFFSAVNVRRETLIDACYEVAVSKYLPGSILYLRTNGLRDEDMPMCIGCMAMIDARASGTLFTEDLVGGENSHRMIVHTVRGLGLELVDGRVLPERYTVARDPPGNVIAFQAGNQRAILRPGPGDGVEEHPMPVERDRPPTLSDEELAQLVRYALKIEAHFGRPQDIEWAIDQDGQIWILQARAARISCPLDLKPQDSDRPNLSDRYEVLFDGGDCASAGAGSGPVVVVKSARQLQAFPDKGVLVASRSNPELTQVLHKTSAVVTEVGATTGHLAIMAREYRVPCLMNVPGATSLEPGRQITVDASAGRIYAGHVPGLEPAVDRAAETHPLIGSPVYAALKSISELALPLGLTDPADSRFGPEGCETLHDISRYAHETALNRMFALGDDQAARDRQVRRLIFSVPLDVYVLDIGQGLVEDSPPDQITPEHVASAPFEALIRGMTAEGVRWTGHLPISLRGFMSVMASTVADPNRSDGALGDRSYALISRNYLSFSSRLGYHFSTLDAFVGDTMLTNHVSFSFKGGAADSARRKRRATFIARVLEELGFWVEQKADFVKARIKRIERDAALHQLDMCGRLMGAARQVDVTMAAEETVDRYVERFMQGDYSLGLTGDTT